MGNWLEAIMFGFTLLAFALGLSSVIFAFMQPAVESDSATKQKIEYGFFGVAGLVLFILFSYGLSSL